MTQANFPRTFQLVLGLTIALAGLLFTLDNLNVLRAVDFVRFWPLAFVAIGVAQIVQGRTRSSAIGGAIWIAIGGHMIGRRLGLWDTRIWDYWPLLLVFFGGRLVWQAFSSRVLQEGMVPNSETTVSATAFMGGFDRRIVSKTFERADLSGFMGGGKLDLRDAQMVNGRGVVNVFALMGGFEIIVPDTWSVELEVTPFMGGYDDKTRPNHGEGTPRLVIRGFVMMGGLDIKNR